jgi:hypothetical protein
LGVENRVEVRLRVKDQRFEVGGGDGGGGRGRALSQRYQIFAKRSIESNWVIDSIFELRSIHVRDYWKIFWENKRKGVNIRSKSCAEVTRCNRKQDTTR